jgi:hypothetical protein
MEFDNVEVMKSVMVVGLGASVVRAYPWAPDTSRRRICLCGHQSAREPAGRIGQIARKAEHRWHGARLRAIVSLCSVSAAAPALVGQIPLLNSHPAIIAPYLAGGRGMAHAGTTLECRKAKN